MTRTLSKYWFFTDEFTQDPYPFLETVRREQPVCQITTPNGTRAWLVTRYTDVRAALADDRMSRDINRLYAALSAQVGKELVPAPEISHHLANSDPPRHTPLRRAISFAFTNRRVERLRPRIESTVDDILDAIEDEGSADLVPSLAEPLPIITVAQLMGVPDSDWPKFLQWSNIVQHTDPTDPDGVLDKNTRELSDYMSALIADRHRAPGEDLITALIQADGDHRLNDEEILSTSFALMIGGNDTTRNLLSGAAATLLTHPEPRARLVADPSTAPQVIEELVRYLSPVNSALQRVTTAPVELGGVTIPAGELVIMSLASANRDTEQFPVCPHELDLDRPRAQHVSWGYGIHRCLGSHLAKAQAEIAISKLFTRFPTLRLAIPAEQLRHAPGISVRPLVSVPVEI
ncbi:cytochrome [Actinophytocola xinjiangensis]|uniref:Cytochrome n=1 Tax=Actinophytocola xinjiangensis TaxID=485602 RepID=A0A7Z0WK03_9PSEU|nr:cytochrome P450 [Actinophytocola xinjiangensis]OLF09113.1 cytochrome [Actinophytocola xinjiangensis]